MNPLNGRREGRITEIVSRKQTEFVGHYSLPTNYAFFVADSDKPMPDIFIPLQNVHGAKNKDKVVVRCCNGKAQIKIQWVK
jgi:ribonuclease R